MMREHGRTVLAVGGVLVAALAGVGVLFALPRATARVWTAEPGPLQAATVILYAVAAVAAWRFEAGPPAGAAGGLLLALLGLIKLDPGGWILAKKADSLAFYASADIPFARKVIAAAVFLLAAGLAGVVLAARWRRFRDGLRRKTAGAVLAGVAVVLLFVSFILDRIQGAMVWPHPGYHTHPQIYFGVGATEEVLELLVPGTLLAALALSRRRSGTPRAARGASPAP
jgi:hypothetical protein